jgi:hypothetical protein
MPWAALGFGGGNFPSFGVTTRKIPTHPEKSQRAISFVFPQEIRAVEPRFRQDVWA